MGKKKTQTTQTQQNTYQYTPGASSPDIDRLRNTPEAGPDPSIPFQYSKLKAERENMLNNPLGSATSAATHEAFHRANTEALSQDQAAAQAASQYQADQTNYQRKLALAGLTRPDLVQTGGTSTGQTVQSGGFWSGLLGQTIGAGAQIGSAALM